MADLENAMAALELLFEQSGLTLPAGLRHILLHLPHTAPANSSRPDWGPRRRLAAALFRGLWYGSDRTVGADSRAPGRDTPTYVYPEEVRWVMRARFPDDPVRLYDGQVEEQRAVYFVDVVDLATATWPSCRCGSATGTSGGPARRGRRTSRATPYPHKRGQ
ncbi:PREDICTED: uncharacterized protein LOC109480869 [Branchiostoma belcheri]|uniref:Uncharacterized protein LOC109480869 n=1 Tax=Branchiostoma belcheri TaxID=7741 RepID=A0A6P4ZPJ5_BRABE|nr:PREDICTED: uncharacterized protein LOC109480869 [Branchiostoma belcheri]